MLKQVLFLVFMFFIGSQFCSAQQLKRVFKSISEIEGFQMALYSAEEYGYPKEMGEMKMSCYGNSDPCDKVLDLLSSVSNELMKVNYVDDRGKITRVFVEKEEISGDAVLMQVFIGKGTNDLCVWIFTGATLNYYLYIAQQIYDDCYR